MIGRRQETQFEYSEREADEGRRDERQEQERRFLESDGTETKGD